jgi:tRNA G10  N-methylase Trm11
VIIEKFAHIVHDYAAAARTVRLLDPFAGTGGIHKIPDLLGPVDVHIQTYGLEIQPMWACAHQRTWVGNALDNGYDDNSFDFIMTSPCYGNRMADHHNAKDGSKRITYRHYYGEDLEEENAGTLQWTNPEYKIFHAAAWAESLRVLKRGGIFVVNISNHIRGGEEMPVVEWHLECLLKLGLFLEYTERVRTPRMRMGANAHLRVEYEHILVMRND